MSNPFQVNLPDKDPTKVGGVNGSTNTTSTQSSREAQEKDALHSTDIYTYAAAGTQGTTPTFQNYDGFTRTSEEKKDDQEGSSLLDATGSATGKANGAKGDCEDYSDKATEDNSTVKKGVKTSKTKAKQMEQKVSKDLNERESLGNENDEIENEVDSLNSEISTLMAEDGQDYTPEALPESGDMPMATPPEGNGNVNNGGSDAGSGAPAVEADAPSADIPTGNSDGQGGNGNVVQPVAGDASAQGSPVTSNPFAMNSLPAQNTQQNGNQQNNGQGQQSRAAAPAQGNSLASFGGSLVQAKGKNADKINDLLSQVSDKTTTYSSNNSQMSSLTASATKTATSFKSYLSNVMNQTVSIKKTNASNNKGAQAAQTIGTTTSLTGGVATAVGATMTAYGNPLGVKLTAAGGIATVAGTTTSAVASGTQGDTQGAVNTATNGLNSFNSSMNTYKTTMADIKK